MLCGYRKVCLLIPAFAAAPFSLQAAITAEINPRASFQIAALDNTTSNLAQLNSEASNAKTALDTANSELQKFKTKVESAQSTYDEKKSAFDEATAVLKRTGVNNQDLQNFNTWKSDLAIVQGGKVNYLFNNLITKYASFYSQADIDTGQQYTAIRNRLSEIDKKISQALTSYKSKVTSCTSSKNRLNSAKIALSNSKQAYGAAKGAKKKLLLNQLQQRQNNFSQAKSTASQNCDSSMLNRAKMDYNSLVGQYASDCKINYIVDPAKAGGISKAAKNRPLLSKCLNRFKKI